MKYKTLNMGTIKMLRAKYLRYPELRSHFLIQKHILFTPGLFSEHLYQKANFQNPELCLFKVEIPY